MKNYRTKNQTQLIMGLEFKVEKKSLVLFSLVSTNRILLNHIWKILLEKLEKKWYQHKLELFILN